MLEIYDLPRLSLGSGRCFVQVPETHPARDELRALEVEPDCVQVGTGSHGPRVFLFRLEDWAWGVLRQRNGMAPRATEIAPSTCGATAVELLG